MKLELLDELKRTFRPEFLNRVDEVIVFHSLAEEHLSEIVELMLRELTARLADYSLLLEVTGEARAMLAREGYDPVYGARPLRRVIQKRLEDEISEKLLRGVFTSGDTVIVDVLDGQLTLDKADAGECKADS
jgi:ATP-dependent Clp protease ATP-binding subunit ClpC